MTQHKSLDDKAVTAPLPGGTIQRKGNRCWRPSPGDPPPATFPAHGRLRACRELPAKAYHDSVMSSKSWKTKNPRTWNRRDFSVRPAGLFSVLNPDGWFAASRLPGGFRYLGGQTMRPAPGLNAVPKQNVSDHAGCEETTPRLQTIEPGTHDHPLMRPALIVLGATAITSILLWWTAFPRFH